MISRLPGKLANLPLPTRRLSSRILLLALIAFNLVVKLLWLGVNELAHDEPFTVYWSQQPFDVFLNMLRTENNPPLYFLLIKAWSATAPFEVAWLRVPSALFSALTVWPLYLLARRLGGSRVALIASLLYTLNNYHYGFAHEVRAYSLFALLATTGMWLLWRALDKPNNGIRAMLGLSAVNTLMVYTHFFGWLAIGVQALCVLALPELRHLRRNFLLGIGITLMWFSPYLVIFLLRLGASVSEGTWLEVPVPEELYNMLWRWSNAPVLAISFLALILVAAVRSRMRGSAMRLAMIWCMVPLLGMFAVSFVVPMFLDRYLVFAAPGFALLVACSMEGLLLPAKAKTIMAALAIAGMAFTFVPWAIGERRPSGTVAQVDAWCAEDCSVEVVPTWYWLNYLAAEDLTQLKEDQSVLLLSGVLVPDAEAVEVVGPTILVDASGSEEFRETKSALQQVYGKVDSVGSDHRVWVYRFSR